MWWFVAAVLVLLVLVELKTTRPDGTLVKPHPYRQMLPYLMPTPNGAIAYYDEYVRAEALLDYIAAQRTLGRDVDVTDCLLGAIAVALDQVPKVNRFMVGRRLYQRRVRKLSFSALRRKKDRGAEVSAVHLTVGDAWSFDDLHHAVQDRIAVERSGRRTYTDKELRLTLSLPRLVLGPAVAALKWLDARNLLPGSFIANDPLYCSAFLANLGSIDMRPGYHHLYDWGNCPIFVVAGKIGPMPMVEDGAVVVRQVLHLRISFDERIDDGLNANDAVIAAKAVLEDPFTRLGCLSADGSDRVPLTARA
ncbi:MAG: hypothetical protein CVT82_12455 [Alphaproteobacteria bacterium HGW-Alphaproteobacteria-4]|jgi:hypothetical protein|nr:MAG: hypothetical protein CVT82_12455 [Alphaproteobacteria bacterium HGW-Alphaproteobacteria-4]